MAFSPDGHTLASGSDDNTAVLWDLTDRSAARRLGQPLTGNNGLLSVGFSPDGNTLAIENNGEVLLWDLTALITLHNDPLRAACARGHCCIDPPSRAQQILRIPEADVGSRTAATDAGDGFV
jgi:hypothetical protein